jgi:glycosyltransferase involved in cell wall biosynthesis
MTQKLAAFICMTGFLKEKLLDLGVPRQKIFVKPHFLDASQVVPMSGQGDYVLYLGRLSPEKGIWTLIHAFEKLKDHRLKIVGTGPLEDNLKKYVRDKGLRNIELLGFKDGTEKWGLLRNSAFTVVPSILYETFGVAVLEAYAAGKPVVASRLGSLPYVIEENKSGTLFEPGCVDDLVNKVVHLINRPDEVDRMGRYARSLVESAYSPEACYQKLTGIFSSVRSNGNNDSIRPGTLKSRAQET